MSRKYNNIKMVKLTKNMFKCLEDIKLEVTSIFNDSQISDMQTIIRKPTKKKVFKAITINLGKPSFQFYINDRFIGSFFFDKMNEKWNLVR